MRIRFHFYTPNVKLFLTYLTVFLVASLVAGIFLFLYSGIKTNNISSELAFSLIATLSLTLQILTVWYLLLDRIMRKRERPRPDIASDPETKAHMST